METRLEELVRLNAHHIEVARLLKSLAQDSAAETQMETIQAERWERRRRRRVNMCVRVLRGCEVDKGGEDGDEGME